MRKNSKYRSLSGNLHAKACKRRTKLNTTRGLSSGVAAVIRGHTRMLSANVGRSQGIRRMLSAFTKKLIFVVGHCR